MHIADIESSIPDGGEKPSVEDYKAALGLADAATCEAVAVSQAAAGREAVAHHGYGTYIYARMCAHATAFMMAAPLTRWASADWTNWDFASVAGHVRALLDGLLLFQYLTEEPEAEGEWSARLNVMHLNDCMKRLAIFSNERSPVPEQVAFFEAEADRLRKLIEANVYFKSLDPGLQKQLLKGRYLTIRSRDEQVLSTGLDLKEFNLFYDVLSHYVHVLPMSFYRMEANGRGTGIENDADRSYMTMGAATVAATLREATNLMCKFFPDVATVRKGIHSVFSPGPRGNAPKRDARRRRGRR